MQPGADLQRCRPAHAGLDSAAVLAFLDAIEDDPRIEPHGLIVQRHGRRVVEGYWAPHRGGHARLVYSVSKTFTGTALGLQIGEGRLTLDDPVAEHLPERFDGVDDRTRRMRTRHIATMASGHDRETLHEARLLDPDDPVRGFLHLPPDAEPGSLFCYNQPPVLALATILQRRCGERLSQYLRPRLLDPLGIGELRWTADRHGVELGYSGVHTDLDAVARLGQLYLDDGVWQGRRILPEGWVAEASRVHIPNPQREDPDWQQGYGIQLWNSRHGYRGDGAFGQYMVVLPDHDAVIAMFACTEHMQVVLDAMWALLLPGLRDAPAPSGHDDEQLAARLAHLRLPSAAERGGAPPSPRPGRYTAASWGPMSHRTVTEVEVTDGHLVLHEDTDHLAVALTPEWTTSADGALAASAGGDGEGRLLVHIAFLDTPHRLEVTVDPATATFGAQWPALPLFAAGVTHRLGALRAPTA